MKTLKEKIIKAVTKAALADETLNKSALAKKLKCSRATIYRTLKDYNPQDHYTDKERHLIAGRDFMDQIELETIAREERQMVEEKAEALSIAEGDEDIDPKLAEELEAALAAKDIEIHTELNNKLLSSWVARAIGEK